MKEIKILRINTLEQKHGDHLVFAFMSLENLKTYCYVSLKQLEILRKDFKLVEITETQDKSSYWTKKVALEEKKIINIGLFYILKSEKEREITDAKKKLNIFKKTPLLEVILSDKPEIFYGIKTTYSYKDMSKFRFYQFTHNERDELDKKSISYKVKGLTPVDQLSEFIFGKSSKDLNKLTLQHLFLKDDESFELNYHFIRYILFIKKLLSTEEIIQLLAKPELVKSSKLYKDEYLFRSYSESSGLVIFFNNIKDFGNKKRLLLKWNIPPHIMQNFNEVMSVAYPKLRPDLDKVSDPLYFYNNLSRDYGRLCVKDFKLKGQFSEVAEKIDGIESGPFEFKIPKKYSEMIKWGSDLCNCAGNFDQIKYYSEGLTVGVFKDNKIVYLIDYRKEWGSPRIKQLKGFKNRTVKIKKDFDLIVGPFISNGFMNSEDAKRLYKCED